MKFIEIDTEPTLLFKETETDFGVSRVWIPLSGIVAIDWEDHCDFTDDMNGQEYEMIGVKVHFAKRIYTVAETAEQDYIDAFFYNIDNARSFAKDFKSWLFNDEIIYKWHDKKFYYEDSDDYEDYEAVKKAREAWYK